MKYIPMLFSTPMVHAIDNDLKTQTRRKIKPQPDFDSAWRNHGSKNIPQIRVDQDLLGVTNEIGGLGCCVPNIRVPYHVGDIIWVREKWRYSDDLDNPYDYWAIFEREYNQEYLDMTKGSWKPSLFMPREACRLFLEVTAVRIERLQDISENDAIAEGIEREPGIPFVVRWKCYTDDRPEFDSPGDSFASLWHSLHGVDSWISNPYVWVVEFKRIEHPAGFL